MCTVDRAREVIVGVALDLQLRWMIFRGAEVWIVVLPVNEDQQAMIVPRRGGAEVVRALQDVRIGIDARFDARVEQTRKVDEAARAGVVLVVRAWCAILPVRRRIRGTG